MRSVPWGNRWYEHPRLAGEKFKEGVAFFNEKTDVFLETLRYCRDQENNWYVPEAPNDKRIALFAHWGVGDAVMSHILGVPYPQFVLSFGTLSVIEFKVRDGIVIPQALTYGNDSRLYMEGLPTKFENRIYI